MKRAAGVLALGVLVVAAGAGAAGARIAAHRGGAALAPENGLTAFRGALALGVDALELDVHLTADGVPVVIHDATLERTTTGRGAVGDIPLPQLRTLHLKARDGSVTSDTVPTLTEVLDLAPIPVEVLPEIKTAAGGRRYPGIEEKVLAALAARRFGERATLQAFDEATIRRVRELEPTQRTMLLVSGRRLESARAEATEAVRWASALGATDLGMDHRLVDARVIAAAGSARIRLSAWTVNTEADLRRLLDLGVDLVMSDHPDLALRLAGRGRP